MKWILILIFSSSTLFSLDKEISLVLPWKHQFQFAGYYMAKEKGFYKEFELDVSIIEYESNSDNAKDVSMQKYQFGVGHSSLLVDKINKYYNLILLNAINQSSPFVLISTKYKELKDVRDKVVMMTNDQTSSASINAMLYSQNLEQNSYSVVESSFDPISLVNGRADFMTSYMSNEPYTLIQKGIKPFIMDPKDYGFDFYSDILFTTKEMIQKSPQDVENFRVASLKGWQYAYDNIDETVDIILKYYNTQHKTEDALRFEADMLKKLAYTKGTQLGEIKVSKLQEITTAYRLLGLVKSKDELNFQDFIYGSSHEVCSNHFLHEEDSFDYMKFVSNLYFRFFLIVVSLIILTSVFFNFRTKKLLMLQFQKSTIQNKIFDENICSSIAGLNGHITHVSKAFCELTGYTEEELLGRTHNILKSKETPDKLYKDLWITISNEHIWRGKFQNVKKDGSSYWVSIVISPVCDENGNIVHFESILHDITLKKVLSEFNTKLKLEVKKQTEKLEKLAVTDKLTGIYNRVKLDDELDSNFACFEEFSENFSVIIIDIDHFKNINDKHGHQVGDIVLQELVQMIKKNIRSTDTLGRWGGEEFMVICPKADVNISYTIAQKIRQNIEKNQFSRVGQLTICAGVCDAKSAADLNQLVSHADTVLYDAKHSGRNMVVKYEGEKL